MHHPFLGGLEQEPSSNRNWWIIGGFTAAGLLLWNYTKWYRSLTPAEREQIRQQHFKYAVVHEAGRVLRPDRFGHWDEDDDEEPYFSEDDEDDDDPFPWEMQTREIERKQVPKCAEYDMVASGLHWCKTHRRVCHHENMLQRATLLAFQGDCANAARLYWRAKQANHYMPTTEPSWSDKMRTTE